MKKVLSWSHVVGAIVGLLSGFVVGAVLIQSPAGALSGMIFLAVAGGVIAVESEDRLARMLDPRVRRYEAFKAATDAFDAALKNAEEQELRTRERFWLSLSGHQFELELADLFKRLGYVVERTPGSRDHGVDLILRRGGRTTVVQCKRHTQPVGPAVARELYGTLVASKADEGILATVGGATSGVHAFFSDKPLRVILTLQNEAHNL